MRSTSCCVFARVMDTIWHATNSVRNLYNRFLLTDLCHCVHLHNAPRSIRRALCRVLHRYRLISDFVGNTVEHLPPGP